MFSLHNLGLAYRKAKVDLYYTSHALLGAIANYEEDLIKNLEALQERLEGADESWVNKDEFIGGWTLATKSVDMSFLKSHQDNHGNDLIFSSPAEKWAHACGLFNKETGIKKPKAEFRVMAQCSLDFHVLSSLWMLEVGHLFDAKLTSCAYGNRMRRTEMGEINKLSLGTFQNYFKPFCEWRDKGIDAMRAALDADKKIVALTADVSSFYHELNPDFMRNSVFLDEVMGVSLDDSQKKLHRLFIQALKAWADATPLKKGLPVGLPASAVVANAALIELDRIIEKQLVPLYYGRYVDDILLVMENGADFQSSSDLWEWIFSRSGGKLGWGSEEKHRCIIFKPNYLSDSKIQFANTKNKIFMLSGDPGKALVNSIAYQIKERASEWRAMPRLPRLASHVGTDLLAATQSDGEAADNLRKADILTMRRASFAIKLRDFEAYERDLLPDAWREHRQAFFSAFVQHVLVLPQFFDLAIYLPRVIRLAVACENFDALRKMLQAIENVFFQLDGEKCELEIKACPKENQPSPQELMRVWKKRVYETVSESISAAFPPRLSKDGKAAWKEYMANYKPPSECVKDLNWCSSSKYFQARQSYLFSFDLAHMPFRFIGLPMEMVAQRGIPAKKSIVYCKQATDLLPNNVLDGIGRLARWIAVKGIPNGLLFATRPYSLPELFILNKSAYRLSEYEAMKAVVLSVRGFNLSDAAPSIDERGVLQIPDIHPQRQYGIAVSSWKTEISSWIAAVTRMPDPDVERYARLCRLLDGVITQPQRSRYLVLPELALPAHWFIRVARKLQGRGISLITGIEYLHAKKKRLRNQVWAALSHNGLGFPSLMIYRQDKQRPALHEEQELQRLAGLKLTPDSIWKIPPILQHGNFRFALMICSELTNISYRAALRGKVDALFVPEWNQDIETFNALVESAALDIHAYIIQCNDRQYGDSRIRAPFKDGWRRDLLRVKGGVADYCVIGEIDVQALREFQSSYRSPGIMFKPVPDGFELDLSRKVLPGPSKS